MAGGGGKQTTTTDNSPWVKQQPFLEEGYNRARQYLDSSTPNFFPGQTVAAQGQGTQQGIQGLLGFGGSQPYTTAVDGMLATARGDYLDPSRNPAFQGMVTNAINAARPSVDAAFASTGRLGSGAHANAFSDAALNASTSLAYQDYGRERQNQMAALNSLPGMGMMGTTAALQGGGMQDAYSQALIDAERERYDFGQNRDYAKIANYMQLIGSPTGGSQTTTVSGGGGNPMLQAAGAGIGLLGGLGTFGTGFAAMAPFLGYGATKFVK